jgi:hypothetical protein
MRRPSRNTQTTSPEGAEGAETAEGADTAAKKRPSWLVPTAVLAASAVVIAGTIVAINLTDDEESTPTAEPTATSSPTPTSTPTPTTTPVVEGTNFAPASFDAWSLNNRDDIATRFSVDRDTFQEGVVSLRVTSTATDEDAPRTLSQTVNVQPGTNYNLSAWVRTPELGVGSDPVEIVMGSGGTKRVEIPAAATQWTQLDWTYTTGPGQTQLDLSVVPTGATPGVRIDQLQAIAEGDTANVLANGSFETFTAAPNSITNANLLLDTGKAGITLAWQTASLDWTVENKDGTAVASGTTQTSGGEATVPLYDLPQGYYSASIAPTGVPGSGVETAFIILDEPAPGSGTTDSRIGVGTHIGEPYYVGSEEGAAAIGFTAMRSDAYWGRVETAQGAYTFPAEYEQGFFAFEDKGINVLPISNGANKLYDGGKIPSSQSAIDAYARYTAALVDHYNAPEVEIFNELNGQRFNNSACGLGAECYLPILKSAYEAVKASSPGTLVLGPANGNQDDPYLTELYRAGGLNYLDAVTYHPYTAEPEALIGDIQGAQARIKEYNNGVAKPIWLTEFGWTATGGPVSEVRQANYLVRSEVIALANGVEKLFWYDLVNDKTDPVAHEGNFGLFRRATATTPLEPKPGAMAQALLIRKISNKDFSSADPIAGGYSYVFGTGGEATRVAWATTTTSVEYTATGPVTITTASGAATTVDPVDGKVAVQLGEEPIYVQGPVTAGANPAA